MIADTMIKPAQRPPGDRLDGWFRHCRGPVRSWSGVVWCALSFALAVPPAQAAPPTSFTATADQPLRFGTIVTANGGSRTVGADGSTSSNGVFPLGDQTSGPAQFTLTFSRPGGGDHFIYQLTFQFSLPAPANVNVSGIQGSLSGFTTDLPGVPTLQSGQTAVYTLPSCSNSTCAVTFHIGATLNVARTSGGGSLAFPLVLLSTVTAVLE